MKYLPWWFLSLLAGACAFAAFLRSGDPAAQGFFALLLAANTGCCVYWQRRMMLG